MPVKPHCKSPRVTDQQKSNTANHRRNTSPISPDQYLESASKWRLESSVFAIGRDAQCMGRENAEQTSSLRDQRSGASLTWKGGARRVSLESPAHVGTVRFWVSELPPRLGTWRSEASRDKSV
jgi:hypothetical protein